MNTSSNGIRFLKNEESCRLSAYVDTANKITIGWGSTHYKDGSKIKITDSITQEKADELLWHVINQREKLLNSVIKFSLTQNEFDSLISFTYNIGEDNFKTSGVLRLLNEGRADLAADRMLKWNKETVNGVLKVSKGLSARRARERELFLKD